MHVTRGSKSLDDAFTYRIQFHTTPVARVDPANLPSRVGGGKEFFAQLSGQVQTYTVTRAENGDWDHPTTIASNVKVAPWNIGPRTDSVVYKTGAYDNAFASQFIQPTSEGGRVFVGPRDDGFYADLGGIFDLANLRPAGTAQDGLAGYNVQSIALEIPTPNLTGGEGAPADDQLLGVWASASRRKVSVLSHDAADDQQLGPWVQVSRLGLPLINEALIGIQDKDRYNRSSPRDDVAKFGAYFLNPVIVRDAEAVGIRLWAYAGDGGLAQEQSHRHPRRDQPQGARLRDSAVRHGRRAPGGHEPGLEVPQRPLDPGRRSESRAGRRDRRDLDAPALRRRAGDLRRSQPQRHELLDELPLAGPPLGGIRAGTRQAGAVTGEREARTHWRSRPSGRGRRFFAGDDVQATTGRALPARHTDS